MHQAHSTILAPALAIWFALEILFRPILALAFRETSLGLQRW